MKRILLFVPTVLILILSVPQTSFADTGILIDCDKSTAFTKRLNGSIKKLEVRLAKYDIDSPPALAITEQIEQTRLRFDKYRNSSLLCGLDGLPHLITDGDLKHSNEFVIPGILFLYITGWIGWSGRKYLQTILTTKNPTEKEIIVDVPLALNIMLSGYLWPTSAWNEFVSGDLIAED